MCWRHCVQVNKLQVCSKPFFLLILCKISFQQWSRCQYHHKVLHSYSIYTCSLWSFMNRLQIYPILIMKWIVQNWTSQRDSINRWWTNYYYIYLTYQMKISFLPTHLVLYMIVLWTSSWSMRPKNDKYWALFTDNCRKYTVLSKDILKYPKRLLVNLRWC